MLLFARFIQQFHCDKRLSPSDDSLGTANDGFLVTVYGGEILDYNSGCLVQ